MFITSRNLPIVNFSPLKRIYMNSRRGYNNIKNGSIAIMSGYTPQLTCTASLTTYMYTYLPRWASLLLGGTGFSPHWSVLANYTMYVQYMYMYQPVLGTTHFSNHCWRLWGNGNGSLGTMYMYCTCITIVTTVMIAVCSDLVSNCTANGNFITSKLVLLGRTLKQTARECQG